jgi:BASS family bile acid:Na+ symporter
MHPSVSTLSAWAPRVLASIALVAMMLELGFELEPVEDRATKRRKRRLVLRALVFNFAIVPVVAVVLARGLRASGPVASALLLLAASPGGRHAPVLAKAARGDVALAVEITLFSCKVNSFVSPLLAKWMLGTERAELRDLTYVIQLLALQMVPYFGARQLRKWRPQLARLARPAAWLATGAALVLAAYLIAHEELRVVLLLGVRGWVAVLAFGALVLMLGWLVGGNGLPARRTFAITTVSRNGALALVIGNLTVGDRQTMLALFGVWLILLAIAAVAAMLARQRPVPLAADTPATQH